MRPDLRSTLTVLLLPLAACATPRAAPLEMPAPPDALKRVVARSGAVTSANPLASEAGVAMLRAGGNAVDAAVATAFAIGVVEPQMSGLGGSGALLVWRQQERLPYYLDFYAMQNAESFRGQTAERPGPDLRIVGIPGLVAGLLAAHERFGRLPLGQVLAPAIRLADEGFPVGQILAQFIRSDSAKLHRFAESRARMWPNGRALAPGAVLRNPELAATLRAVAERGRAGFYDGAVARALVAALNAGGHPATLRDLAGFEPVWKRPLCAEYRGRTLLSAPPPQTGAQVIHTLKLLEPFELASLGLPTQSARAFDVIVSALRVGQADNRGNDDPRWRAVPAHGRITDEFVRERQPLVGTGTAAESITAGNAAPYESTPPEPSCAALRPWPQVADVEPPSSHEEDRATHSLQLRPDGAPPASQPHYDRAAATAEAQQDAGGETTHISVVDADGNAVALTQTNSSTFGAGAWVSGFFLNDSGFRFTDANSTGGSSPWRTRTSTIAPTIVLEDGRVRMVTGAPGSGRIPTEIAQTLVYVLDYGMDPLDALRMPRIFPSATSRSVQLEHGFAPELLGAVRRMGYEPEAQSSSYARLYMIVRAGDRWIAVADPRHDGQPRGY